MTPTSASTVAGTPSSVASKGQPSLPFASGVASRRQQHYGGQPMALSNPSGNATVAVQQHADKPGFATLTDQNATTIVADVSSTVSGAARQTQPSSVSDELCFLKLLVPNVVAGSIIGPKGAIISHISSTTRCTVKLSHSTCYFPGTTDRVIMLSGKLRDLKAAFCLVLEKIRDSPSNNGNNFSNINAFGQLIRSPLSQDAAGTRTVVKIVVPNSAVSQLIGKQGRAIKELQETTKTKIQISSRDEHQFKERVVTISGTFETVSHAAMHVAESIQSDPHIKDHMHINYISTASSLNAIGSNFNCFYAPGIPMLNCNQQGLSTLLAARSHQTVERHMGNNMEGSAASFIASQQLGPNASSSPPETYFPLYDPIKGGGGGARGEPSSGVLNPLSVQTGNQHGSSPYPPVDVTRGSYLGIQNATASSSGVVMEHRMEVPDFYVGFLIGKQGASLQAIQQQANVTIKISDKGDFVPGTNNRRVVITGDPMAIQYAAAVFQHRLQELDEIARRRNAGVLGFQEGARGSSSRHVSAGSPDFNVAEALPVALSHSIQGDRETPKPSCVAGTGVAEADGCSIGASTLPIEFLGTFNGGRPPGFSGRSTNVASNPTLVSVLLDGTAQGENVMEYQCDQATFSPFSNFSAGH